MTAVICTLSLHDALPISYIKIGVFAAFGLPGLLHRFVKSLREFRCVCFHHRLPFLLRFIAALIVCKPTIGIKPFGTAYEWHPRPRSWGRHIMLYNNGTLITVAHRCSVHILSIVVLYILLPEVILFCKLF